MRWILEIPAAQPEELTILGEHGRLPVPRRNDHREPTAPGTRHPDDVPRPQPGDALTDAVTESLVAGPPVLVTELARLLEVPPVLLEVSQVTHHVLAVALQRLYVLLARSLERDHAAVRQEL